jgi:hypothetical protein
MLGAGTAFQIADIMNIHAVVIPLRVTKRVVSNNGVFLEPSNSNLVTVTATSPSLYANFGAPQPTPRFFKFPLSFPHLLLRL